MMTVLCVCAELALLGAIPMIMILMRFFYAFGGNTDDRAGTSVFSPMCLGHDVSPPAPCLLPRCP